MVVERVRFFVRRRVCNHVVHNVSKIPARRTPASALLHSLSHTGRDRERGTVERIKKKYTYSSTAEHGANNFRHDFDLKPFVGKPLQLYRFEQMRNTFNMIGTDGRDAYA